MRIKNKKLSQEILQMARLDQKARKSLAKDAPALEKVQEIDGINLIEMKKIVKEFGWPAISLVGKKASHFAWLLIQHADSDVRFQEHCLKLMIKASKNNDVSKANIAFLTDRILVNRAKPQIYGTQFYENKAGRMVPKPMRNTKELDRGRKEMELENFETYKNKLRNRKKHSAI